MTLIALTLIALVICGLFMWERMEIKADRIAVENKLEGQLRTLNSIRAQIVYLHERMTALEESINKLHHKQ